MRRQISLIQHRKLQEVQPNETANELKKYGDQCEFQVVENAEHAAQSTSFLIVLLDQDADNHCRVKVASVGYISKKYDHDSVGQSLADHLI